MHHVLFRGKTGLQIFFPASELTFSLVGNNTVIGNQYFVEMPASHLGHYSSLFLKNTQAKSKMFRCSCVWQICPYTYKWCVDKWYLEGTNCRFGSLMLSVCQPDLPHQTLCGNGKQSWELPGAWLEWAHYETVQWQLGLGFFVVFLGLLLFVCLIFL